MTEATPQKSPQSDEDLVRRFLAGDLEASDELAARLLPKIKGMVSRSVRSRQLCPESHDANSFIEDVISEVFIKFFENLSTYRFEQPLDHWLSVICANEAENERRRITGRKPKAPRRYVSWEEWKELQDSFESPPNHVLQVSVRKIIERHRGTGVRGAKSTEALELANVEGLTAKEIAEKLKTSSAYVNQLISHDYKEMYKDCLDQGITGADL